MDRIVSKKVESALGKNQDVREPVIEYLRELEVLARQACHRRETIQILGSGRRLLGDRTIIGTSDGPFAHTLGLEP